MSLSNSYWRAEFNSDINSPGNGNAICRWNDGVRQFEFRMYTATDSGSLSIVAAAAISALAVWQSTLDFDSQTALTIQNNLGGT